MLDIENMLAGNIRRVSHVARYSSYPTIRKENVAEHLYYASLYSFLLAKGLENYDDKVHVDYGKLLSSALVHDIEENITGDFVRIIKYSSSEFSSAVQNLSVHCVDSLSKELGIDVNSLWLNAKDPSCIEGQIMALADFLTVVSYVIEELKVGNTFMHKVVSEVSDYLISISHGEHKGITHEYLVCSAEKALDLVQEHDAKCP